MTISNTPRFGLPKFSAGGDPFLTRAQWNAAADALDGAMDQPSSDAAYLFPELTRIRHVDANGSDSNNGRGPGGTSAFLTIGAALADVGSATARIIVGPGTFSFSSTLGLNSRQQIRGSGKAFTTLSYTGSGTAVASATPGTRTYDLALSDLTLSDGGTGTLGIDLDSVSSANIDRMVVTGFDVGVRIGSAVSGGAVYNTFYDVTASVCPVGFKLEATGSNETKFIACRANACSSRGFEITDCNHTIILASAIESCGVGVYITATSNGLSDSNTIANNRLEGNTTAVHIASAFVRDTMVGPNHYTANSANITDSGSRTRVVGAGVVGERVTTAQQDGGFVVERVVNGGSELPMARFVDGVTSSGTPVTVQAETERAVGYFFRGKRGGSSYFDVDSTNGNLRLPQGGNVELAERAAAPAAPATNSLRLYAIDNGAGKTQLCVRFATGAVQVISTEP